jgi:hypothetical protein
MRQTANAEPNQRILNRPTYRCVADPGVDCSDRVTIKKRLELLQKRRIIYK